MLKPLQKVYKLGASHSANMWGDVVNYCVSTIRETCGSEGTCPVADLLEWEIMRAWVCKLSTRKMVVKQSACGESDGIRVRDTRLHKFSPILKKKKSANTHAEALLHLAEGESYALGVGLLALAGWVSQFEINFFSCIFALLRSWPIATLLVRFFNFQGR